MISDDQLAARHDAVDDTAEEAINDTMTPGEAFSLLGIDASEMVIDDDDPFAGLDPQWARLSKHLMTHFDPSTLPAMMQPFAPAATAIMANKLASEPVESREMAIELINMAVRDLAIDFAELDCWEAHRATATAGEPESYKPQAIAMVGRPLEPAD